MAITKIENLISYITNDDGEVAADYDNNSLEFAEFFDADEVRELVNYLQSKLPTWNKFDKNNPPDIERTVFILTNDGYIHTARYGWDSEFNMYIFKVFLRQIHGVYFNEVTHWCYADDFNKAFQTGE